MSTEFKPKDRVSINKDLPYTTPRFGVSGAMREIFTGTVKHNPYQQDDEVDVMLDYPDDVSAGNRIAYSYDPRDLTLITDFKAKDKVSIDKNLTYTAPRFGVSSDMEKYFTGTVSSVYDERVYVNLKSNENVGYYTYDPRDLTLIPTEEKKEGNPMSKFKKHDRVTIDKSLKFTKKRFGLTDEMRSIFTGVIIAVEEDDKAIIRLDGGSYTWTYDLNDLTLATVVPTNVKTSNETTIVTFSDGSTTSVTKSAGDPYDLETAIAYCIAKKVVTNSYIKHLAKNAEEVLDKVTVEFYNKFLKPYGFLNETAYVDVEIETLKNYLKTLNDVRSDLALIAIENNLSKDELFNKLRG